MIAKGKVKNIDVTVGAQDFRFIGGSFGAASGEAFITGVQHAINNKTPLIFFSCSGGQRMMESSIALMQMTRTTLAINELKKNKLPYIVVLTDPTTGGVTASWGMLGDILIAEPKATIGFAGRRVIQDTVRETLPEEFQTAEYVKDHGGIDLVIERKYLNSTIGTLLSVMLKNQRPRLKKKIQMPSQSISLYNQLAKKKLFKKTVNFDLKRIKQALNKLENPERKLKNVINVIGSDGKYSVLNSLKYFIEENNQTSSAYISPSLKDIKERFWMGSSYLSYSNIRRSLKKIESLKLN